MFLPTPERPLAQLIVLTGTVLVAAGTASAQFQPGPVANYAVGPTPSGLATGDFDGDGDMDLATTVENPDRIAVLLNDGTGTYVAGPASFLPASSSPQDLAAADMDGDGDLDLVVARRDPVGSVVTMLNNGAGSFAMLGSATVGDRPRGLSVRDLDADGDLDVTVANRDSLSASVLLNNGTGTLSVSQTLAIGGETRDTALGDLDGDGDADLVVSNADGRSLHLFTNTGGSFAAAGTLSVGPIVRPDGVVVADLDADTDMDIATATSDQTTGTNQAAVFQNTGTGFTGPFGYNTMGTNTSTIAAADLDCDGLNDLATGNIDSNNVSMLRNLGGATFGAPQLVAVGTSPDDLLAADLDNDGDPDLSTANRDSGDVSVIVNDTCDVQPCPWDTSGDGLVNIVDLLNLLAAWGPNPGHPADFDNSGSVDIVDLLALLGQWGACP